MRAFARIAAFASVALGWGAVAAFSRATPAVQTPSSGEVVVWITDDQGDLLNDGWSVEVFCRGPRRFRGGTTIDPQLGFVTVVGVPPGECVVFAERRADSVLLEGTVVVTAGEKAGVRLQLQSAPPEARIDVAPPPDAAVLVAAFGMQAPRLVSERGEAATLLRGGCVEWQYRAVDGSEHRLIDVDPRYRVSSSTPLRSGVQSTLKITGTSALRVVGRTPDGSKIRPVLIELSGGERMPWTHVRPLHSADTLPGLVASTYEVTVGFAHHHIAQVSEVVLTPGETTTLVVDVPPAVTLRGRVIDRHGAPLADAPVRLRTEKRAASGPQRTRSLQTSGGFLVPGPSFRSMLNMSLAQLDLKTDSAGEFVAVGLPEGLLQVSAAQPGAPTADWIEWLVELPAQGERTICLENGLFGDLHVDCSSVAGEHRVRVELTPEGRGSAPAGDGSVRSSIASERGLVAFEHVPVGRYKIVGRAISDTDAESKVLFERKLEVAQQRSSYVQIAP